MRLALLFSGQGDQQPAHFDWLRKEASPETCEALSIAIPKEWSGTTLTSSNLQVNAVAQPFLFGLQMTLWSGLCKLLPPPVCVAGYSVGEMAACCAAGCFSTKHGIGLAAQRAALMDGCIALPSALLAVRGITEAVCGEIEIRCGVEIAIRNSAEHFVFGGEILKLREAAREAESMGATRVKMLDVTTPSHTSVLKAASARMAELLRACGSDILRTPVISAIDGRTSRTAAEAAKQLCLQISTRMDWEACLAAVQEMRPDAVLEIGTGRALTRMWDERRTGIPARASDDFRSTTGICEWLRR